MRLACYGGVFAATFAIIKQTQAVGLKQTEASEKDALILAQAADDMDTDMYAEMSAYLEGSLDLNKKVEEPEVSESGVVNPGQDCRKADYDKVVYELQKLK